MPSSTSNLVDKVNNKRVNCSSMYNVFLDDSKRFVAQMIDAFKDNNIDKIQRQIKKNRELLVKKGNNLGVEVETPKLTKLCAIALKYNGSAKSSGASGGDCGVAILNAGGKLDP